MLGNLYGWHRKYIRVQGDANEIDIWYSRNGNKTFPQDLPVIYRVIKSMLVLFRIFKEFRLCARNVGTRNSPTLNYKYDKRDK